MRNRVSGTNLSPMIGAHKSPREIPKSPRALPQQQQPGSWVPKSPRELPQQQPGSWAPKSPRDLPHKVKLANARILAEREALAARIGLSRGTTGAREAQHTPRQESRGSKSPTANQRGGLQNNRSENIGALFSGQELSNKENAARSGKKVFSDQKNISQFVLLPTAQDAPRTPRGAGSPQKT